MSTKNSLNKKLVTGGVSIVALLLTTSGCSKSTTTSAAASSPVGLSGKLTATSASSKIIYAENSRYAKSKTMGLHSEVSVIGDAVHCVSTNADGTPNQADGTIAADGTFSVSITGALNAAVNCSVLDSSGAMVAQFLMKDSSKPDMNGNAQVNDSPTFGSANTKLGNLTVNLDTGDVVIPPAQVVDANGNSALATNTVTNPVDPTGSWTIADVDFTKPKGVEGTCAQGAQDCNGPPVGQRIYLNRLQGKSTVDGSTVYGMQVWQDQSGGDPKAAMDACGDMTGLTPADATAAKVDLSSYGTKNGAFSFTTSITDPHTSGAATITNGYQASTATAAWSMQACFPKTITSGSKTYNTFVCGPDTAGASSPGNRYQASLGGGCTDSTTGAAINNIDWSQVTSWTSCSNTPGTPTGFYTNTCSATYKGTQSITCTNSFGVFNDAALTTPSASSGGGNPPYFNFGGVATLMTQGQTCSTVSDSLTQANCYAQYYQNYLQGATGCLPQVQTDWSATTAAGFVHVDFRPQSLVFMEKLNYSDSNSAGMLTEQTQNRGVQVQDSSGNSSFVSCGVVQKGGLSFKKISDTKLLATYTSSMINTSTDKPACVGASWNGQKQKFIFYLKK